MVNNNNNNNNNNQIYKSFIRGKKKFWNRSKNDYKTSKHLKVDKLAAKKKLKLLTSTDLYLKNSLEPYRVSNFYLFKSNLLQSTIWISTTIIYLISQSISDSIISFIILFSSLIILFNCHLESYKSFVLIRENVKRLSINSKDRLELLNNYLGFNPKISDKDSFDWINKIIGFFWPFLSHLIHFELNEFFRREIESGSLAFSVESSKRLLYALLKQLDTNILIVEKFQLGDQAPIVKEISTCEKTLLKLLDDVKSNRQNGFKVALKKVYNVLDLNGNNKDEKNKFNIIKDIIDKKKLEEENKTLMFDLDLHYNGDMHLSVVYRYLCCCSSRLGLSDVFLRIKLRIILSQIRNDVPFVEQISLTLLGLPDFGYKGIALAELAELKIVRGVLNRLINENLLYPKCLTINIGDLLQKLVNDPVSLQKKSEKTLNKSIKSQQPSTNRKEVSFVAKILARCLLCGCVLSNVICRCCQRHKRQRENSKEEEVEAEGYIN